MLKTCDITIADQTVVLRADRSLWWPAKKILFIADLHAGKTEHFQKAGLRLPQGSLLADLERLQQAVNELSVARLIVLGDLFHSDLNSEWQTVTDWCQRQSCTVELVRGNHDRFISDATFKSGGIIVHQEGYQVEPFTLRHHPATDVHSPVLCGHIHPVIKVFGPGRDRLRLTCFVQTGQQLMLPAYGSFTGGFEIERSTADRVIAVAPDFASLLVIK